MIRKTKIVLTPEQMDYLRDHYPTEAACDIADYLRVSPPVVTRIARDMGLRKSDSFSTKGYYKRYVRNYVHNEGRAVS